MPYRIELFKNNNWMTYLWCNNEDNAITIAEAISKIKKCDVRIVSKGDVIQYFSN